MLLGSCEHLEIGEGTVGLGVLRDCWSKEPCPGANSWGASPSAHKCSLMLPRHCLVFEGRNARPARGTDSNNNSYFLSRPSICQRPYIHLVI